MFWEAIRQRDEYKAEIERLTKENAMLKSLKPWWTSAQAVYDAHVLITKLADALQYSTKFINEHCCDGHPDSEALIQEARKAVK
jgi:hypothetical protein